MLTGQACHLDEKILKMIQIIATERLPSQYKLSRDPFDPGKIKLNEEVTDKKIYGTLEHFISSVTVQRISPKTIYGYHY